MQKSNQLKLLHTRFYRRDKFYQRQKNKIKQTKSLEDEVEVFNEQQTCHKYSFSLKFAKRQRNNFSNQSSTVIGNIQKMRKKGQQENFFNRKEFMRKSMKQTNCIWQYSNGYDKLNGSKSSILFQPVENYFPTCLHSNKIIIFFLQTCIYDGHQIISIHFYSLVYICHKELLLYTNVKLSDAANT